MQSKAKKYGEYVEITAPVERTTSEEYPTLLGGEIWYNQNSSKSVIGKAILQEFSWKSWNPIKEKKQEFQFNQSFGTSILGQYVQQETIKSEIKEAPRSIPCRFVISQIDKILRFHGQTLNKTIQAQSSLYIGD